MFNYYDLKLDNGTAQLLLPIQITEADRDRLHALVDIAIRSQASPVAQTSEYECRSERAAALQIQQSIDRE